MKNHPEAFRKNLFVNAKHYLEFETSSNKAVTENQVHVFLREKIKQILSGGVGAYSIRFRVYYGTEPEYADRIEQGMQEVLKDRDS